jgi:hypothetical protein
MERVVYAMFYLALALSIATRAYLKNSDRPRPMGLERVISRINFIL